MRIVLAIFAFVIATLLLGYSAQCAYFLFTVVDFSEVSLLEDGDLQMGVLVTSVSGLVGLLFAVAGIVVLSPKRRKN